MGNFWKKKYAHANARALRTRGRHLADVPRLRLVGRLLLLLLRLHEDADEVVEENLAAEADRRVLALPAGADRMRYLVEGVEAKGGACVHNQTPLEGGAAENINQFHASAGETYTCTGFSLPGLPRRG